jgi:hypothetical protein
MILKSVLGVVGWMLMVVGAAAAETTTDLWLHIRVHDAGEGSKVSINLPLAVVEAAAPLIPEEARGGGARLRVENQDLSVADLRRIWRQVQKQPDTTFITVDDANGKLRVARSGGFLLIRAADAGNAANSAAAGDRTKAHGDKVEMRIPASVIDALLAGDGDSFDMGAAIRALAKSGSGELVTVNGDNETVHLWVDANADSK